MTVLLHQDDYADIADAVAALPQSCVDLAYILVPMLPLPEDVRKYAFTELRERNTATQTDPRIGLYALELEGKVKGDWRAALAYRKADCDALEAWVSGLLKLIAGKTLGYGKVSAKVRRGMLHALDLELTSQAARRERLELLQWLLIESFLRLPDDVRGYARPLVDGLPDDAMQPVARLILFVMLRDCATPTDADRLVATYPEPVDHPAVAWLAWCSATADRLLGIEPVARWPELRQRAGGA